MGEYARQHHDLLVDRFITHPAMALDRTHLEGVTASGPPLQVLLRALRILRDYRCAEPESESRTRHDDLARLRDLVG